jgi:predicted acetyltransferase
MADQAERSASKLISPSREYRVAFAAMARDWREHGNDRYGLALDDFDGYLAKLEAHRDPARLPPGWVPSSELWLESDAEIVACVRLRYRLTPALEVEGGHIGYDVRPSFRGRGFGTAALRLALPEARRLGLLRVLLTVDADNLPSIRVIERNGGRLSGQAVSERTGKVVHQYWLEALP